MHVLLYYYDYNTHNINEHVMLGHLNNIGIYVYNIKSFVFKSAFNHFFSGKLDAKHLTWYGMLEGPVYRNSATRR